MAAAIILARGNVHNPEPFVDLAGPPRGGGRSLPAPRACVRRPVDLVGVPHP